MTVTSNANNKSGLTQMSRIKLCNIIHYNSYIQLNGKES